MRKLNVLEFSNQWSLGGTEKTSQLIMKYIDKDRFNIYAAGFTGGERLALIQELAKEVFISESSNKIIEWIKSKNIDIIHFHRMGSPEPRLMDMLKACSVKILIEHNIFAKHDHTIDDSVINRRIFVSNIQKEIYESSDSSESNRSKNISIYNPVETEVFNKCLYDRDYSLLTFGRHSRKDSGKWNDVNIRILPYVKKEIPDAKFICIGLPDSYREMAKNLGVEDMIVERPLSNNQEDIVKFLNEITIFTHSSDCGESFGNSIAEAMASGIPVITHTGGDSAQCELVDDMHNGYVIEFGEYKSNNYRASEEAIEDYAKHLIFLLKDQSLKLRKGILGKKKANRLFSATKIVKQIEDIFLEQYEKSRNI